MKRKGWKTENSPKQDQSRGTHPLAQGSLKGVHSSEIEFFLVKFT